MEFAFTDEQDQFRGMLRRFLNDTSPTTEVRRLMETEPGYDRQIWRRMSDELALPGLAIPEEYGGAGFGMIEVGIAMEEMGRALLCAPYFASSILASNAIELIAGDEDRARLLPGLAAGEVIGTLAVTEGSGRIAVAETAAMAEPVKGGYRLSGSKKFVLDGMSADLLLVVARLPDTQGLEGLSLFEINPEGRGVRRRALATLDPTRKLAAIDLDEAPAVLIGKPGAAAAGLVRTLDLAAIALANEMAGGAARLLEDTLAYTKLRVQFGRSIASFQAIKHRCAELLLNVELAKSAAYYAAAAAAENSPDLAYLASLAKAGAAETYLNTAAEAIQLHGGVGFTWEQDTQLWFKRAKSSEVLFGDPAWHRERMIQELVARGVGTGETLVEAQA